VHRFDVLRLADAGRRHDRLGHQLAAEDDGEALLGTRRHRYPIAALTEGFEVQ
jgi:hypothetical protein